MAIYDAFLSGGHRTSLYVPDGRARIPGRFAVDFVALPPSGTFDSRARGVARNGFGAEVLAVADGVIAAATDDMPDNDDAPRTPRRRFPIERASGNYVALPLGGGRVAFYDGNSLLGAEGVPFVFRSYRERGAFAGIDAFVAGTRWLPREGATGGAEGMRRHELPAPNSVIDFGGGKAGAGAPRR